MSVQHGPFGGSVIKDEKREKEGKKEEKEQRGTNGLAIPGILSQKARESSNGNLFKLFSLFLNYFLIISPGSSLSRARMSSTSPVFPGIA